MRKFTIFFLFILCFFQHSKAQYNQFQSQIILSDTARISLLTSSPWEKEIYALFGHTAIRINDPKLNIDEIFNYGIFDFNTPNFIFRFVKGETDYMVASVPYRIYIEEYKERGVGVVEQILNLNQKEKQDIIDALRFNSLPENRVYRYNFFYDNCATRPRDIIEKYIEGKIEYTASNKKQTYRDLVWECTDIQPWAKFGIDLVIGADADKVITDREKDFLPRYLMNAYNRAIIINTDTTNRALLLQTHTILEAQPLARETSISPFIFGCIVLIITTLLSLVTYRKKWFGLARTFDTLLFFIAGLGGCIIFFLMFFSEHPCTNPNWNIVWLNPLQLVIALLFFVKSVSKYIFYYHFINFVGLLVFLLAWCLIPQQLEIAFIPFILCIGLRSTMNVLQQRKLNKKAEYSLPKAK